MRRVNALSFVACSFCVLFAGFAMAQEPASVSGSGAASMPGAIHPGPASPSRAAGLPVTDLGDVSHRIDLSRPEPAELAPPPSAPGPLRIGFERNVPRASGLVLSDPAAWRALPDGSRMLTVAVTSTGATGLRVGLRVESAPADTLLLVHGPGVPDRTVQPLEARDAMADTASRSGRTAPESSRLLWSGVVDGDTALLDIVLPPDADPAALSVQVVRVAHLYAAPFPGDSLSCNRDIACEKAWIRTADAVAHYLYQSGQYTFLCTGTLLNASNGDLLFVTAAHCVRNRAQASGMTFYWQYERTSCGSTQYRYQETVGGAQFLKATGQPFKKGGTDTSLVRLHKSPPAGTIRSGWTAGPQNLVPVRGIHHPGGDVKKISTGATSGVAALNPAGPPTHHIVEWTRGVTEGGSSGSGIFTGTRFPQQYLIGVLTGGPEPSCTPYVALDFYGRLDMAYPKLRRWLR